MGLAYRSLEPEIQLGNNQSSGTSHSHSQTFQRAHKVSPEPGLGGEGDVLGVAVEIHRVEGREILQSRAVSLSYDNK